jgi:hypothetical protein
VSKNHDSNDQPQGSKPTIADLSQRLTTLTAQMQSGVAFTQQADWENAGIHPTYASELKHLRVGVNSALVQMAALARILERAGICTTEEYLESCCLEMEREVDRYEQYLHKRHPGVSIKAGAAGVFTTSPPAPRHRPEGRESS